MAPYPGVTRGEYSFPKAYRVRKRPEYLAVYHGCKPMHTAHLVFYARLDAPSPSRLGCTASKKVGNAVVRNRVKRLIREVFRIRREAFPPGCTLVVNAKKTARRLDFASASEAFRRIALRLEEGAPT